jgi:DNA/RNA endonuclease YhcR with UshA esterase domain
MTNNRRFMAAALVGLAVLAAVAVPVMTRTAFAFRQDNKSQADVAAKTEFATIAAGDEAVKKAVKATDLDGARGLIGKEGAFEGTVLRVADSPTNTIVFINFGKRRNTAITAVVKSAAFSKFPDLKKLEGKRVLITGKVSDFEGSPEVDLTEASQVKVIKE